MLRLFQAMKKYFKLHFASVNKEKIKEIIEKQYSSLIYEEIVKSIEELSWESILEAMKKRGEEKDEELSFKLHNLYYENKPNQNEILKIIQNETVIQKIFKKLCPHK